ncbi:hypothetical protein MD484_g4515, partial [Candolleomyces efflorescens]
MKLLHRASSNQVQRREPGLIIKVDIPLLPTIDVTLFGKPTTAAPPPAATSPPANTPAPPANSPTPTQAPAPAPAPTSADGGTSASNPSNGGSNTGGGGSNSGGSNNGGSGDGQSTPSPSQGSSGGQNPSSSSTPGNPGGSDTSGGGTGNSGGDTSSGTEGSGAGSGSSNPNGSGGANNLGSSFPGSSSGGDSGHGNSNPATDGSGAPVVNAGGVPGFQSGGGPSGTSTLNSGTATIRISSSGTQDGSSPTQTNTGDEDGGTNRGGLPQAAGIVIAILFSILFLIGLILFLRRHRKAQRDDAVHRWWFTKKRTSRVYNDDRVHVLHIPDPQSARSSFATTFDRSAQFEVNFNSNVPALPPMAEVRRSRNELDYPIATPTNQSGDPRFSIGSSNSGNSNYFFIDHRPSMDTTNSYQPTNVNPFQASSSERFAFPKPPSDISSDRKSGVSSSSLASTSRPISSDTNTDARTYRTPDTSPSPPEHQNLPAINADPFADEIVGPARSTSSHTTDPFSDSTVSASHETSGEGAIFAEVLRPFTRSMPDELTVRPGDQVKVLQVFDDGWAVVDMVPSSSPAGVRYERGLVPLGCLR